jgi:hypothetical protein
MGALKNLRNGFRRNQKQRTASWEELYIYVVIDLFLTMMYNLKI